MGKRLKKKVVLFLVEGQSDINALSYAISQFYEEIDENYEVYFPTLQDDKQNGGDITSKYGIAPENIEKCINKLFLDKFLQNEGLYPKDISEIVQIVDIDGAYISGDRVIPITDTSLDTNTIYKDDHIETKDVSAIIERNNRKQLNLNHLISLNTIKVKSKTIKYSVYFFSSNMDHYLHGNANMDCHQKCIEGDKFSMKCIKDSNFFYETFMNAESATINMSYEESWEYIKEGNHSLERHTNLNILISKLITQKSENS